LLVDGEFKWKADDTNDLVVRCSLIVVREMEWNADDADNADFHRETLSKLCVTL